MIKRLLQAGVNFSKISRNIFIILANNFMNINMATGIYFPEINSVISHIVDSYANKEYLYSILFGLSNIFASTHIYMHITNVV